jgi:hypothetical protein
MRLPMVWRALGHRNLGYRKIPLPWGTASPWTCLLAMWNGVTGKILELIRNSLPHWTIPTRGSVRWQRRCFTDVRPVDRGKGVGTIFRM